MPADIGGHLSGRGAEAHGGRHDGLGGKGRRELLRP